jgi:flagellar protein FliS
MFGSMKSGANAYAKVGVETGVLAASPHKLVAMLFEGAEAAIGAAIVHMKNNNVAAKGASISKAILIIDNGLCASLDAKAGGEIAANLDALYKYMVSRLLQANLKNSQEMLEEVRTLLADLRGAWEAIGTSAQPGAASAPAAAAPARSAYDNLAPRSATYQSA